MDKLVRLKLASEIQIEQLKKLSTENLIIWIIGKSEIDKIKLTIEEITIECWLINPQKHSMRCYEQFPDTGVVTKRVYEMKGKKGMLNGTIRSGFFLTEISKSKFADIDSLVNFGVILNSKSKFSADRSLSSIDEAPYKRLRRTPAYLKFEKNRISELVETDYLYFYGITWHTKPSIVQNKIKNIDSIVDRFAKKDIILKNIHIFLNDKFGYVKEKLLKTN
ncbi:MAG: hypothetical protein KKG99_13130 [Bacteroidetes bacterium]|nr:hypothetical protein [Bacteroidota bacterium]